ncbi:uncharacterized protein LY79DRAFT_555050 [Colletotrichum navitas]|uniref:Uncharacterized protein n=1 Tax=Colletotrichum navitas TaxID=681940 RepID=A0AAD8V4F2_9PEZI|nr:uncharacterized protein LY79DRAFT_555050 [Colletotrichum navitas]KAK1590342.1 hypothetical protein LY79DRAFT_555050 [Colletotrichum navitas]
MSCPLLVLALLLSRVNEHNPDVETDDVRLLSDSQDASGAGAYLRLDSGPCISLPKGRLGELSMAVLLKVAQVNTVGKTQHKHHARQWVFNHISRP